MRTLDGPELGVLLIPIVGVSEFRPTVLLKSDWKEDTVGLLAWVSLGVDVAGIGDCVGPRNCANKPPTEDGTLLGRELERAGVGPELGTKLEETEGTLLGTELERAGVGPELGTKLE